MKMIKFVSSLIFITMLLTSMCPTNAATIERSVNIEDGTDDVYDYENDEEINYPTLDIKNITCIQTGSRVDLELRLVDSGSFQKTFDISYTAFLATTSTNLGYVIMYTGANSELSQIWPDADIGDIIITDMDYSEPLAVISESIQNNILSVSFNLKNDYERVLGLYAETDKIVDDTLAYSDVAPDDYDTVMGSLEINAGGEYSLDAGQTLQLEGNLVEEGNPTDYEWIWVFDGSLISLEGRNPTHKFSTPGERSGVLYAYDDEGNWGMDVFTVTVNETSSSNGGGSNNNEPGFELIIVIGAIAIALVILRRKK